MKQIWGWIKTHRRVCLAAEIIILAVSAVWCMRAEREVLAVPLEAWESELAEFDGTIWRITEEKLAKSTSLEMLAGPHIRLPKGSYSAAIVYQTEVQGACCLLSNSGMSGRSGLKADDVLLEPEKNRKTFRFEATEDIEDFEMKLMYGGSGGFEVREILIWENRMQDVRKLAYLCLVFLAVDSILFAGDLFRWRRMELCLLSAAIVLVCLPELVAGFYYGHDIGFHLLRIEGIAEALRLGNFPARVHALCLDGYGYPLSIYYGDLFLYFPALLRIAGFSVMDAYKMYLFAINAATVLVSYLCFQKIFRVRSVAFLGMLAYVTNAYRMVDLYVRAAVGEYTAMLAFPILALALYRIYETDETDWKAYRKNAWLLAIGMSGLLASHMLSTEMAVFVLALLCVILYKKTFRRNTICVYLLAVAETGLLSAYFLVPFLDYWKNVSVNITDTIQNAGARIQDCGAYIGQYFAFFENVRGSGSETIVGRMQLTPGLVLMAALLAAGGLLVAGVKRRRVAFYAALSVFFLWLSSNLFPWDFLVSRVWLFRLLAQVQFPWRYIGIAVLFLTLLLCELLLWVRESHGEMYKACCMAIGICAVLMVSYMTGDIYDGITETDCMDNYDTASLDTMAIGGGEYLRTRTNCAEFDGRIKGTHLKTIELRRREGLEIELYCETDGTEAVVEVPLLHYKGYHVYDETGHTYAVTDGANDTVCFVLPADFAGRVTVSFKEPMTWRLAEVVSLLTVTGILIANLRKWKCWGENQRKRQRSLHDEVQNKGNLG